MTDQEHSHDVCAIGRSVRELKRMAEMYNLSSVDWNIEDINPAHFQKVRAAVKKALVEYTDRDINLHVWSPASVDTNEFFAWPKVKEAVGQYETYIREYGSARLYIDWTHEDDTQDEHECVLAYDQEDSDD